MHMQASAYKSGEVVATLKKAFMPEDGSTTMTFKNEDEVLNYLGTKVSLSASCNSLQIPTFRHAPQQYFPCYAVHDCHLSFCMSGCVFMLIACTVTILCCRFCCQFGKILSVVMETASGRGSFLPGAALAAKQVG